MEDNNPYASLEVPPAAMAAASERAEFLKKVYGILFLGILGFAGTLWGTANIPVMHDGALALADKLFNNKLGWLIYMAIFIGGQMGVHALAEKKPINAIAFAGWVVLMAFLISPLVLFIDSTGGAEIITQASGITALVFLGLTAIVLVTGKDFSWMGGMLYLAMWGLLVVGVLGWAFGFSTGLWMSWAFVMLFAGYILYDTSVILHHLPTNMAMTGAIMLFTDVVLLFKHLLILLYNRD